MWVCGNSSDQMSEFVPLTGFEIILTTSVWNREIHTSFKWRKLKTVYFNFNFWNVTSLMLSVLFRRFDQLRSAGQRKGGIQRFSDFAFWKCRYPVQCFLYLIMMNTLMQHWVKPHLSCAVALNEFLNGHQWIQHLSAGGDVRGWH